MTYIDVIRSSLRESTVERVVVVPTGPWTFGSPIEIAQGSERHCAYDHRRVVEIVGAARMTGCVLGHVHCTDEPPLPSFGDCRDAMALGSFLRACGIQLQDYVIVNRDGQVFSFAHQGILSDPMKGLTYAKAAEFRAATHQ